MTLHGHADDEAHGIRSEDWGILILLGLGSISVLVITKNYDASLGAMWVPHFVWLDGQDTHGGNRAGSTLFTVGTILRQCDCVVGVH